MYSKKLLTYYSTFVLYAVSYFYIIEQNSLSILSNTCLNINHKTIIYLFISNLIVQSSICNLHREIRSIDIYCASNKKNYLILKCVFSLVQFAIKLLKRH